MQSNIETIQQTLQNRVIQIEECEEKAKQSLADNRENLGARIEEEKEKLDEHISRVQSETLMNRDTPANDALKELRQLKKKYDETLDKITTYQSYEDTLKVDEAIAVP